jgi:Kef-type K+ transport system membrane component KefB
VNSLLGIGIAIIVGFVGGKLIGLLKVPSVAGYIIAGVILGKSFLGILTTDFIDQTSMVSDIALAIIAFSIGGELVVSKLKEIGIRVFFIALSEGVLAFAFVFFSMRLLNQSIAASLLLGAVASATAPAATVMVLSELRCKGPLTSTLIAVVAIDDVICLMIYAVASAIAKVMIAHGETIHWSKVLIGPLYEIGGSVLLGIVVGGILVLLLRKFNTNNEVFTLVVVALFATIGLANILELSTLLCNMTVGIMISNLSARRLRVFSVLDSVSAPIYIAFFVLAGARLDISLLLQVGIVGIVYTIARMAGKITGASLMATVTKADPAVIKFLGFGLISQIGVAVGLAIVISHEFSGTGIGDLVITVLLATTIITEIVGPLLTKMAVIKTKEAYQDIGDGCSCDDF